MAPAPPPPPSPCRLPTELLLEVFIRCTQLHPTNPTTLYKLAAVNKDWRAVFKTYERMLWRTATLSAFPDACFSSSSSMTTSECELDWKETFLVYWGWNARKGHTTVIVPGPPPPLLPLRENVDITAAAPLPPPSQVVVSIQEALLVQASSNQAGTSHVHGLQNHHHNHHHVHDHHFLMNQQQQQQQHESLESTLRGSLHAHEQQHQHYPTCTTVTATTTTTPNNIPFILPCSESDDILNCSLCTYSDICLIPQARVCVRTFRTRMGGPLMQVLDWSLRHAIDIGGGSGLENGSDIEEDVEVGDGHDNSSDDGESEAGQDVPVTAAGDWHQDLVSGMAVNEAGGLLVSCSIDGTVRVWDVLVREFGDLEENELKGKGKETVEGGGGEREGMKFMEKVEMYGCPIRARRLLTGHVGWVNAVAIEDTTVVSGGSDHTVRVWDALSGTLLHLIPDLFTSRALDLGVFTVAIHSTPTLTSTSTSGDNQNSTIVGVGSVIEGYQILDLKTGTLLLELDEPLTSRQHSEFETETYQQYASKMAITATVILTNSKVAGRLCVWDRWTGELLYRIRVCGSSSDGRIGGNSISRKEMVPMVSYGLNESSRTLRRVQGHQEEEEEEEETIHTFKVNRSGSMLMCTLCDGRVALFEFGSRCGKRMGNVVEEEVVIVDESSFIGGALGSDDSTDDGDYDAHAHGPGTDQSSYSGEGEENEEEEEEGVVIVEQHHHHNHLQHVYEHTQEQGVESLEEGVEVEEDAETDYACGALAWIWARDRHSNRQRVILV